MAARRIAKSSVDWAKLAERVPEDQKVFFIALKGRSDNYLRRVLANPETAPKIDFATYKKKIPLPGLTDTFQKEYEAYVNKIAYPKDTVSPQIDAQEKQAMEQVKQFIAQSNQRIAKAQQTISKWDEVLPFEDMTLEDFKDAFPERSLDPLRRPTFWPHNPEEQLDYKEPGPSGGHH